MNPSSCIRTWSGCLFIALLVTGCDSPGRREAPGEFDIPKPVAMQGETTFFEGKLRTEASISRGRPGMRGEHGPRAGGSGSPRRRPGGGMGGPPEGMDDGERGSRGMQLRGSPIPPVTLRIALTNTSGEPLDVQIRDVNSELGHFAARPERVNIAPGETAELDPMISQLGAVGSEIPVSVELRVAGKTERQDIAVKTVAQPEQR